MTSSTAIRPTAHSADLASTWDTELLVLCARDRASLRDDALALARWTDDNSDIPLADLAFSLIDELQSRGSRLAIVAASCADFRAKLMRAAERLADPKVSQIRDVQGIYYFDQPLYAPGAVALLMPGEGAQSVGMLDELCRHFPEVAAGFHWCDRVAEEAGRHDESLRSLIFPPAENRAAAEAKLRQLGPSIFSVLVADLAVNELVKNLRLPISAYAGHSAGELAALYAGGAIPDGANSSTALVGVMDLMQRQEDDSDGPETLLLATGAGKAAIAEIVGTLRVDHVFVAMDNCPHQSVVVGAAAGVTAVECALQDRGILCERLSLRRPYHTPLFAPWMGPFYELFDGMPINVPHTPVYCATTGGRFPDDPDAIRKLTVDHWKSPVEFTRMIETMYADGVRLFIESGPRGNLSAFVEDVLRGRPFAALPIDSPRRNGVTQLNHVVAQLLAHHVPMNAEHLFANRNCERIDCRASTVESQRTAAIGTSVLACPDLETSEDTCPHEQNERAPLLMQYLDVMEQFLDVQREVMAAWLQSGQVDANIHVPELEAALTGFEVPSTDYSVLSTQHSVLRTAPALGTEESVPSTESSPGTASLTIAPGTLIGEIVRLEPGCEVVVRRRLDLAEDRYAGDHTIGGRSASRVNPDQHGLPVMPMTFSLELMAECTKLLFPNCIVPAIRDIRLSRWQTFDAEPITIEVTATAQPTDAPTVQAVIRDLSNGKVAAQAVVEVADDYPEPPVWGEFPLTNDRPCKANLDDLYRNFFHGPLFQGMRTLDRLGDEGIEGTIVVLPRDRWFASTPEPRLVTDPVFVDVVMHIIGAWHLEQPDWSGRILLPIGVKRIEFFGPPPTVGSVLRVRSTIDETSARHFVHSVEAADADGRLWCRLVGAGYWRFYLPFGHVNFFGPKDEYFLCRPFPEALPPSRLSGRCWHLEFPADLLSQPALRTAGARVTMTARELAEFYRIHKQLPDAEVNEWLFTRIVGKDAIRSLRTERYGDKMFPADIELHWDGKSRPMASPRDPEYPGEMPNVSIAHLDGHVAAAAAFHPHVGVALAKVGDDADGARRRAACDAVNAALDGRGAGVSALLLAQSADGTCPPEVRDIAVEVAEEFEAHGPLLVRTLRVGDYIVATTYCEAAPT